MQTAHGPHHIVSWAQVQVVGVGQLYLRTQLVFQVKGADTALDGGLCAHVHENGSLYLAAVGAGEHTAPGAALLFNDFEHLLPPVNG